jgi:hypothetical protein
MFGSGILDTVIGLIFVFLLVSMLVTITNEIIAAALLSRAKWLRLGISRLLGSEWAKQLYAHPLIESTAKTDKVAGGGDGPSYITSRSFATVLMEIIQKNSKSMEPCRSALQSLMHAASAPEATVENLKAQLAAMGPELRVLGPVGSAVARDLTRRFEASAGPGTRKWLDELGAKVEDLLKAEDTHVAPLLATLSTLVSDGKNAKAGIEELRARYDNALAGLDASPATAALKEGLGALRQRLRGSYTVADAQADIVGFIDGMSSRYVRQMIEEFPDDRIRTLLLTLFDDAKNDVDKFKENIEAWFNNGMDRVNGWYKRKSQWVLAALGLGIAVLMNVDTILIFKHLQSNSGAREALVGQARAFTEAHQRLEPSGTPPAREGAASVASGDRTWGTIKVPAAVTFTEGKQVVITSNQSTVKILKPQVTVGPTTRSLDFEADTEFSDKPSTATITANLDGQPIKDAVFQLELRPSLPAQFRSIQANAYALAIPIGWVSTGTSQDAKNGLILPGEPSECWDRFLQHIVGWLLTALAATLGAPFWFDTLNRIISIRSSGKAPEERPKPPKEVSVPVEPGQSHREADRLNHYPG